ncbi:DNA-binding transcriptional regulator, LysR family [Ferrimonas sediminum]|uniref:DNA-binding transcriptional regulator, LysR family n=1 Tax=Ferrimonas sediminum TaxID=718193 RepID=A0A1G9A709_9GAMM|nr:DNA-binding transcriptional regulator, LysR family [Ferrimonas sediminum]
MNHLLDSGRISMKMLRYFAAVAQRLHFGLAASDLCISKSALSTQVRELESVLGLSLLDRSHKRVTLTAAGAVMKLECEQLLAAMEQSLNRVLQVGRSQSQTLNIGLISSAVWDGLFSAIESFRAQRPQVAVNFIELAPSEQRQALREQRIDVGLCRDGDRQAMAPFSVQRVKSESMWVVLSERHPLALEPVLSLRQLQHQDWVMFDPKRSGSAAMVQDHCRQLGFVPRVRHQVVEPQTMMAFVSANQALALVPECFRRQQWHKVRFVPLQDPLAADLCVVHDSRQSHRLVATFIDTLLTIGNCTDG